MNKLPKKKEHFVMDYNEDFEVNWSLIQLLPEWLRNFETNCENIKFEKTIHDLPKIKNSALIIDHPFSGSFDRQVEDLKNYKGTIFCCDRALFACLTNGVIPDYVVNVDSSYLCLAFYDLPEIRKHMDKITALFAVTTFPLTIRAWTGKKAFFSTILANNHDLTESISAKSKTDILRPGGCVHNTCWSIAYALGAKTIGLYGIDNSYDKHSQAEHNIATLPFYVKELGKTFHVDRVYELYATILFQWLDHVGNEVVTINTTENGIMYDSIVKMLEPRFITDIKRMTLKKFVEDYK